MSEKYTSICYFTITRGSLLLTNRTSDAFVYSSVISMCAFIKSIINAKDKISIIIVIINNIFL